MADPFYSALQNLPSQSSYNSPMLIAMPKTNEQVSLSYINSLLWWATSMYYRWFVFPQVYNNNMIASFTIGHGIEGLLEKTHWPDNRATFFPLTKQLVKLNRSNKTHTKLVVLVALQENSDFEKLADDLTEYSFVFTDISNLHNI